MCDTEDSCPTVLTTCCEVQRPECETRTHAEEDGTVLSVDCLLGFGCAPDAKSYLDKLRARFG